MQLREAMPDARLDPGGRIAKKGYFFALMEGPRLIVNIDLNRAEPLAS
jgi:hypothetical protein